MKKFLFLITTVLSISTFAQSDKYVKAIEAKLAALDTTRSQEGLKDLANSFERIAEAEKTQWLPFYYAALATVNSGFTMNGGGGQMGGNTDKLDPIADKAESLLKKAEEFSKDNSEIYVVKKMIATLRMIGDPMNRYMQYGPEGAQALETAQKLNPENPRIYLLMAEDKFYTPEQFGGSKQEAKKLLETALQKYETFKPESSISPNWGRNIATYFIQQASK